MVSLLRFSRFLCWTGSSTLLVLPPSPLISPVQYLGAVTPSLGSNIEDEDYLPKTYICSFIHPLRTFFALGFLNSPSSPFLLLLLRSPSQVPPPPSDPISATHLLSESSSSSFPLQLPSTTPPFSPKVFASGTPREQLRWEGGRATRTRTRTKLWTRLQPTTASFSMTEERLKMMGFRW